MDIKKYFQAEGFISEFKCFDGRLKCEFNQDEQIYGKDLFQPQLQWTDMFGIEKDKVIFKFDKPKTADAILNVIPLTPRFTVMQCRDMVEVKEEEESDDDDEMEYEPRSWYILELDWLNKKCTTGTHTFTCDLLQHINHDSNIWIDQAADKSLSKGDLHFIVYKKEKEYFNCKYCKINAQNLQYQQKGTCFQLPINLFKCVNLNGTTISGLSALRNAISFYDLNTREILTSSTKPLQGTLPPAICLDLEDRPGFDYTSSTGAWTSTHLYLWSEEEVEENESEEEKQYLSYIYEIEIQTGIIKKLSYKFDGRIRQIFVSADKHLLVHLQKFLREENYIGPAWCRAMYGRKPFFEFKMYCLQFLRKQEPALNDYNLLTWQSDVRYLQNKGFTAEIAHFE